MSRYDRIFYKGISLMNWAIRWFKLDNDSFYKAYGFNFNPHDYCGLYEEAREKVFENEYPFIV